MTARIFAFWSAVAVLNGMMLPATTAIFAARAAVVHRLRARAATVADLAPLVDVVDAGDEDDDVRRGRDDVALEARARSDRCARR